MNILITSSSFLTASGSHHDRIKHLNITKSPGPLNEITLLSILERLDSLKFYICGDDEITSAVINKLYDLGVRSISKYGVGLDSIDVVYAQKKGLKVFSCAGINSSTVAEHTISLILFWAKRYKQNVIQKGAETWSRAISRDISGLTVGILGLGSIGWETAKMLSFFGAIIQFYDPYVSNPKYSKAKLLSELINNEVLVIHSVLNDDTLGMINDEFLSHFKGELIVNMSRAKIIEEASLKRWLSSRPTNTLATDVLYTEPPNPDDWMLSSTQVVVTPHVGSRSVECIEKTSNKALDNLNL